MDIQGLLLLVLHVLCLTSAAIGIALLDSSMFKARQFDGWWLRLAGGFVVGSLALLWITGLSIAWLDTGFDLSVLVSKPKLVAKLSVVTLCCINGWLLHRYFLSSIKGSISSRGNQLTSTLYVSLSNAGRPSSSKACTSASFMAVPR
jgi:hypothetical protein